MPRSYEEIEDEIIKSGKGLSSFKRMIGDMLKQKRHVRLLVISIIVTAVTSTVAYYAIGLVADQITRRNLELLIVYALLFLSMYIIQFFSNRVRTTTSTFLSQNTIKNIRQVVPIYFYSSMSGTVKLEDQIRDCCLACSCVPHDAYFLPFLYFQVYPVQRVSFTV